MVSNRFGAVAALVLAATLGGCRCDDKVNAVEPCKGIADVQADQLNACTDNSSCGEHYACSPVKDRENLTCCLFADRKCTTEADCCPGQTCPAERKKCFDKFLSCETDADCGDKGDLFCESWVDNYGTTKRCRFHACGEGGLCPTGQSCFQNECMVDLPCGGSCPTGQGCVPSIDRCQDYSAPTGREAAACPVSCNAGFMATFQNNRDIWDTCNLPAAACICAELPSLRTEDLGRYSALASDATKGELYVSAYDGQYGDLVVLRYNLEGALLATEYVDGVPSGSVKYSPSGVRGGVVEPGQDVGRYTDVATQGGRVFVSYYDVSNGDLKLAIREQDGSWSTARVDGADADLGLYTSIAIDSDGKVGISYFQRGGSATFDASSCPAPAPTGDKGFITALKFARATTTNPTGPTSFIVQTIACQSRPPPPCFNCTDVCADPGTGPGCYVAAGACSSCDPNTEVCVTVNSSPTCAKKSNPANLVSVIDGVGLFSALAMQGREAFIAYMRRDTNDGDLYGVRISAQNAVGAPVLLDAAGDTGYFPDVKMDPFGGTLAVSYHDFTTRRFKYYTGSDFTAGATPEVIDPGIDASMGEASWVGTDSALVFGPVAGRLYAVYQDPTHGDLKLARRENNLWTVLPPLRTEGAVGFFADGVLAGGKLFASHARIHARLVSGEPRVDNSPLLDRLDNP